MDEFKEARYLGITTRPVLVGPVTFLKLAKMRDGSDRWALLPRILPVYLKVLAALAEAGADWVQIDEPVLVSDLDTAARAALEAAYHTLAAAPVRILLATYFGALDDNLETAVALPVAGLHVDLVRTPGQLAEVVKALPKERVLSLGLINGRNIWKSGLTEGEHLIAEAKAMHGDKLFVGPSCSLLHSPVDLDTETRLDPELRGWLAFATQKLTEIAVLSNAANGKRDGDYFRRNAQAVGSRVTSTAFMIQP